MASNLGIVSQSSAFHRLDQSKTEALRLTRILEWQPAPFTWHTQLRKCTVSMGWLLRPMTHGPAMSSSSTNQELSHMGGPLRP